MNIFGIKNRPDDAHKLVLTNDTGWFYFSLGGNIYSLHLAVGRFAVCYEARYEARKGGVRKNK